MNGISEQGQNEVRLGKVQAYVLEALGVNLSKETLRPIVEFMLDVFAYERDRDAAEAIGQPITAEYMSRKHSTYKSWLKQPGRTEPSPFDGVTKINKHNAWRYALYKPGLQSYKRRETRSPLSEPARFYRQLTAIHAAGCRMHPLPLGCMAIGGAGVAGLEMLRAARAKARPWAERDGRLLVAPMKLNSRGGDGAGATAW